MKRKGRHVIFSLIFLVLGYMLAFSFHLTQTDNKSSKLTNKQWDRDLNLHNQIIAQEEKNRKLQQELNEKQASVLDIEKELAKEEKIFFNLAEDAEKYRMFVGKVKVKGKGVKITLADGEYDPSKENVNNYIVHEHHIFKVINELYISGASAIAVNGQRINHSSYIMCNGPVIEIDGNQHPAPFVITAIGDPDVLYSSLNLNGGIKDLLVNENVEFSIEKEEEIVMNPILGN
ncbi:DUF881 domain-containing protein [Cytobacillus sp. Hz8]|uniref:DUF881 domain-containing protein n=1 Tax=Cytobacillus sp. Hz8 TaxID=3347168 RepID=UPI0035DF55B6